MNNPFYIPVLLVALWLVLASCEGLFEYHPNQLILENEERNVTAQNLNKLRNQQPGDTLRLLVMGDTQRFYDAANAFVQKANTFQNIDFVVHQGDITDFGMTQEFKWIHAIMKGLKWPYLTVIGNHDMLANGRKVYKEMYGNFNYSFVYGHTKFVFLDTNGREYSFNGNVPDIVWLQQELNRQEGENWQQAVVISHMSPFSSDFDSKLSSLFHQTLKQSNCVSLSLHGHDHTWKTLGPPYSKITYHVTTTVKHRGFTYLKIWPDGFNMERIYY